MSIRMKNTRIREWNKDTVRTLVKKQLFTSFAWLGFFLTSAIALLLIMIPSMTDSVIAFIATILCAAVCIGIPAMGLYISWAQLQGLRKDDIQLVSGVCVGRSCDNSGEERSYSLVFSGGGKTWEVPSDRRGFETVEDGVAIEAAFVGGMDVGLYYSKELGIIKRL